MESELELEYLTAEIAAYKNYLRRRYNFANQTDCDRHYDKIRRKAAELAELINSGNTYVHLAKMLEAMNDSPENENLLEYDFYGPITENEIKLRNEFLPILGKLSDIESPKAKKKPIDHYRKRFILNLYRNFWKKDDDPRGVGFIKYCSDAFAAANDNLAISTIEGMIRKIPVKHFKK